eukprot:6403805-Alexandrium_andersonii.AAC.1
MSASLVGSEMCIRDSLSFVSWPAGTAKQCPLTRLATLAKTLRPRHGDGSVSYTHLTLPTICSV